MKRTAIALLGLTVAGAQAQQPKSVDDSLRVNVLVSGFIELQFESPEIVVNGRPGADAVGSVGFTVKSNGFFNLGVRSYAKPSTYRGPATLSVSSSISGGPAGGATTGNISVTVSGIAFSDRPGSYTAGRVVIEVSQI